MLCQLGSLLAAIRPSGFPTILPAQCSYELSSFSHVSPSRTQPYPDCSSSPGAAPLAEITREVDDAADNEEEEEESVYYSDLLHQYKHNNNIQY